MNFCAYAPPRTGKSVFALGMIQEYLHEGRHVVCNFPLDYDALQDTFGKRYAKAHITMMPARPTSKQMFGLGKGYHPDFPDVEEKGGLIVIDEAGTWIGSRSWAHEDRAELVRWFTLSGKLGWDVLVLVQHPDMLDKQIKDAGIELFGRVMRTDRVRVPVLGIKLPRMHIATFRYGLEFNAIKCFSKIYRGNNIYKYFDTHHMFEQTDLDLLADFVSSGFFSYFRPTEKLTKRQVHLHKLASTKKHVLAQRLVKLPPEKRIEFFRRFEACGAFA